MHRTELPLLDDQPRERRDASRNREALLRAVIALVDERGVDAVTMEDVATRAGVGKGTVFRRFGSRAGLLGAVVDLSERDWQHAMLSGPPPLGPGAPAWDRLMAFGSSRLRLNVQHEALIRAAGSSGTENLAVLSFTTMHVRMLLSELGVEGDLAFLASTLVTPLEMPLRNDAADADFVARVEAGWVDLARRVVFYSP